MQVQPGSYPVPPPSTSTGPLKPSAWWFGFAGLVAVVGMGLGLFLLVRTYVDYENKIDDFQRVQVPGSETVSLDAGSYTIYHEYEGADDVGFAPSFTVDVTGPDGSDVSLRDYDATVTYSTPDREGEAAFSFRADESGEYEVATDGERTTLAIGKGLGKDIVTGISTGLLAGFVGVVAGVVIAIIVVVRRSSDSRRRRPPPQPPGYYGTPYQYGPPPGYGQTPPGYLPGYGGPPPTYRPQP